MPLHAGLDRRGWDNAKIQLFSEYGPVAYQIKGNEAYNNMIANILPLHTPLTPGVGSKGQIFISESSHVAHKSNGNEAENSMQGNILPFYTPLKR